MFVHSFSFVVFPNKSYVCNIGISPEQSLVYISEGEGIEKSNIVRNEIIIGLDK